MGIYQKYVVPKLVHFTCGLKPTMKQREKVVPLAEGRVLEIGIGSGLNIPFYNAGRIEHLWGLDPSPEMWSIARKSAAQHHIDVEFIEAGCESIPLDNDCADTVMMTYTMCTIPEVRSALDEIRRVLKAGGKLVFCEHGLAPDKNVQRWQNRLNSTWNKLGGGCNLNRPIPQLLQQAGFRFPDMETMYVPGWRPASFNYWGTATYS